MRLSVIGAGYVVLVSAAGYASSGHDVVCTDTDRDRVDSINRGVSPILESGLNDLLNSYVLEAGTLRASTGYDEVKDTDVSLICVGTPSNPDGSIDLSDVQEAARSIGSALRSKDRFHVVVTRSTVIPGTARDVIVPIVEKYSGKKVSGDIGVASNPEFLQEGKAVSTFFNPDRIIIGANDERSGDADTPVRIDGNGKRLVTLTQEEPLREELKHFVSCVSTRQKPSTDGAAGMRAVAMAEAALESTRTGCTVKLD